MPFSSYALVILNKNIFSVFYINVFLYTIGITLAQTTFDQKLSAISQQRSDIENEVQRLTRQYEVALASHNLAQLKAVLEQSKPLTSTNLTLMQLDAEEILDSIYYDNHNCVLSGRQQLLAHFSWANCCARLLRTVQVEASAAISGLTTGTPPPRYVLSEEVALTGKVMDNRIEKTAYKLIEVDTLMDKAMANNSSSHHALNHTTALLEGQTRIKVLQLLKEFSTEMISLKKELETVYYREVERLRLRGEEMHLVPRFLLFELMLDVLSSSVELAQMYERAIENHDKF